jgi:hypothetical protein
MRLGPRPPQQTGDARGTEAGAPIGPEASGAAAEEPRGWRQRAKDQRAAATDRLTPWPQANRFGTRALLVLLVIGILAGPFAVLRSYTTSAPAKPATLPDTTSTTADAEARSRTQATGTATILVWAWLSAGQADSDALDAMLEYPPTQLALPRDRPSPPAAVTIVDAAGAGEWWTVTVSARGGQAGAGSTYRVTLRVDEKQAVALTLPAQIPQQAPTPPESDHGDGPDQVSVSASDPAAAAAGGFVQTLLSGNGDLSRWTSPGAALTPIRPAICSTAQPTTTAAADPPEPSDGQSTDVLVTVACRRTGKQPTTTTLQYLLTLTARGGRWEVSAYTSSTPGSTPKIPAGTSTAGTDAASTSPTSTTSTPTSATPR